MIQKVPGKRLWRVVSHKKTASGERRSFGTYSSKAAAHKRLGQIKMWKRRSHGA